mmetsp:Transcript_82691/g.257149  ORF Transcript_82691/g.257149 Transcript_82691/m.257149 type:complete len:263 (+) Transcript_82691:60-848(+)
MEEEGGGSQPPVLDGARPRRRRTADAGGNPQGAAEVAAGPRSPRDLRHFLRAVRQRLDDSREQVGKLAPPQPLAAAARGLPKEALCPVCHGPLRKSVALVPCGHVFCVGCVAPWLQLSSSCPTCRSVVPEQNRWVQVRVLDQLVEGMRRQSIPAEQEEEEAPEPQAAAPASAEPAALDDGRGGPEPCSGCQAFPASEWCGPCGVSLGLCRLCAEARLGQCEACESWYCSAWCAARPCVYCSRPHVCAVCWQSPLRRCPRPEC